MLRTHWKFATLAGSYTIAALATYAFTQDTEKSKTVGIVTMLAVAALIWRM